VRLTRRAAGKLPEAARPACVPRLKGARPGRLPETAAVQGLSLPIVYATHGFSSFQLG
jgi:hypothetical protein